MTRASSARRLAQRLAEAAREIRDKYGDTAAQQSAYAVFLRRVAPEADVDSLIDGIADDEAVQRIERELDQIDFDAEFAGYVDEGKDPAIYFYEDFLRAYDPDSSRGQGVHYSPPAVVKYMVNGVESILRTRFDAALEDAFVLDPCCGMGAFLKYIEDTCKPPPEMLGLELNEAVCRLASCLLRHSRVVQADSLQGIDLDLQGRPLVIIANPPYSGHSSNAGAIAELMRDYKAGLNERNPKWLQDDYVKFIRMAQHRIDQAGRGVLAFITNHSFVFNPTFRAMRASLERSFDTLHILDLHGNAKLAQSNADGPDESVFDIQMGVAISFMVKTSDRPDCSVRYAELRGSRESKLAALSGMDFAGTPWREASAQAPFHLFKSVNHDLEHEFYAFPSLLDIFEQHSVGFVTSRDSFAVDFDRDALLERIGRLRNPNVNPDRIRADYRVTDLDVEKARATLLADPDWRDKAVEVLYRPFDKRWAYYSSAVMERPRMAFMESLLRQPVVRPEQEDVRPDLQSGTVTTIRGFAIPSLPRGNIAIAIGRAGQATGSATWDVVFCTDCPADLNLFRRGGAALFPLYALEDGERRANTKLQMPNFEAVFFYIYALLHSNLYRERYAEFLKIDYPRVPLPDDNVALDRLAALGREMVEVHLMRRSTVEADEQPSAAFKIGGWDIPGKYLADRKQRILTPQETDHLSAIAHAVAKTRGITTRTDEAVAETKPWTQALSYHESTKGEGSLRV